MSRRNQGPRLRFLDKRGCFYISWTDNGRSRERSTGTADRQTAEIALAEFIRARTRHAGPRDPAETLVTDILIDYLTDRGPKVRAEDRIAYAVEPLAEYWAARTLADINDKTLAAYGRWRAKSPSTVRRELGVLRAAVNYGHRRGVLTRTVAVELPAEAPAKERWLTRTEAARLLRAARSLPKAGGYLPLFILIGLYTGRRKEAILSLRWSAVDLKAGLIDFRRPGETETKKRRGQCRIPSRLLPHMIQARRFGADIGHVVSGNGAKVADIKTAWKLAVKRAGLPGVTPHTLKHTCATWLMQDGHDPWRVSDFLATSMATVLKVYGHHHPDHQSEIAEAFGRRPQNVRVMR